MDRGAWQATYNPWGHSQTEMQAQHSTYSTGKFEKIIKQYQLAFSKEASQFLFEEKALSFLRVLKFRLYFSFHVYKGNILEKSWNSLLFLFGEETHV